MVAHFGKARERSFRDFVTAGRWQIRPDQATLARKPAKAQPCGKEGQGKAKQRPKERQGNQEPTTMDQPVKSPAQRALDDSFHAMFELSRTTPAPTLAMRLDWLARLRAAV
jgi:hypothetical protein